jgi:hypothetical protein
VDSEQRPSAATGPAAPATTRDTRSVIRLKDNLALCGRTASNMRRIVFGTPRCRLHWKNCSSAGLRHFIVKAKHLGVVLLVALYGLALTAKVATADTISGIYGFSHPGSNNIKRHISEKFSTKLIDWSSFLILGNTVPPRDPDEDEEDEEDEDNADEPPVVRKPDED